MRSGQFMLHRHLGSYHNKKHRQGTHCTGKTGKMVPKNPVRENTPKTQGIWFAQFVNSLILKVKDISIFAGKIPPQKIKLDICLPSQFGVCNSHKSHRLAQGKFAVRQGKQGKHREFENQISVGTLIEEAV